MKPIHRLISQALAGALMTACASAADAPPALSAKDIAAKLSALQQDGSSYVRLKLDVKPPSGGAKVTLQIQIKQRRSPTSSEIVYQVLWPKERAGEAVLLRKTGNQPASGSAFTPPNSLRALSASQLKEPMFGCDLSYADVIENFFAWDNQALVGAEVVDRVNCQILESKPGKAQRSNFASVRTWVDLRRMVPLRVEKYASAGGPTRRIDTTRVVSDDLNRPIPANLTIQNLQTGSTTELDGSKIKHAVTFTDREFTPEGLRDAISH